MAWRTDKKQSGWSVPQNFFAPFRKRSGYVVIDMLVVAGVVVLEWSQVLLEPVLSSYPLLFTAFLLSVALMPRDLRYATELKAYLSTGNDLTRWLGYVFSGFITSLFASLFSWKSGQVNTDEMLALWGIWSVIGISAHWYAAQRVQQSSSVESNLRQRRVPGWVVNLPFYVLAPVAMVHEHFCYVMLDRPMDAYPSFLDFIMVMIATAVIYLPVRMHSLIRWRQDAGNWAWFALTCVLLSLWGVFGVG